MVYIRSDNIGLNGIKVLNIFKSRSWTRERPWPDKYPLIPWILTASKPLRDTSKINEEEF
jgi:hypothetical protein